MKSRLAGLALLAACSILPAWGAPGDDAAAGARKLADSANYAWTTTMQAPTGGGGQFTVGPVSGVAEKAGFAVITRQTPNGSVQIVSKGDRRVVQTPGGWMTPEEMRAQAQGGGPGGMRGMGPQPLPAEEVLALLAGATFTGEAEGALVADLAPAAVAPFLRGGRGGQGGDQPPPKDAAGTLKVWLQNGVLAKYELHVKGTVIGRSGEERVIDRTTVTEIKDVGSTKVEVPAEAKAKLGG
jgi:hypothetical protein